MDHPVGPRRFLVMLVALAALVAVIAWPVLAADPSSLPSTEPSATATPTATADPTSTPTADPTVAPTAEPASTAEPVATDDGDDTQKPSKPPKPDKAKPDKGKGEPVTLTGTVGTRTDADGRVEYTLDSGASVVVLEAGPSWFYGDDHPLKAHVGKRVTVVGDQRVGDDEVDVETVDGVRIREPGKPPWAGGWKVVGERHPGWSAEKAERWEAKRAEKARQHGSSCWPPGHCKDEASGGATATNPPGD